MPWSQALFSELNLLICGPTWANCTVGRWSQKSCAKEGRAGVQVSRLDGCDPTDTAAHRKLSPSAFRRNESSEDVREAHVTTSCLTSGGACSPHTGTLETAETRKGGDFQGLLSEALFSKTARMCVGPGGAGAQGPSVRTPVIT